MQSNAWKNRPTEIHSLSLCFALDLGMAFQKPDTQKCKLGSGPVGCRLPPWKKDGSVSMTALQSATLAYPSGPVGTNQGRILRELPDASFHRCVTVLTSMSLKETEVGSWQQRN